MADTATPTKVRRRNRVINSCLECRRRKMKCSRGQPCASCARHGRKCVFLDPTLDATSLSKLNEIKDKVGSLESQLEEAVARRSPSQTSANASASTHSPDAAGPGHPPCEGIQSYDNDADNDLADIGLRFGRLRISERIGGVFRPQLGQEIGDVITRKEGTLLPLPAIPPSLEDLDCLVPSSFLLMPANGLPEHPVATLPKHQADLLYIQYFTAVDPLAHVLHKPSFDRHYSVLWGQVLQRKPPSKVASALVLSVLFSAAMSLPIHTVPVQFGTDKQALISRLKLYTEHALFQANVIRTCNIETMQALAIFLVPLCRDEVSRGHSSIVGMLIRLATSVGLHRDDANRVYSPLERHIRRLLWYQICYLDVKTVEQHGPWPTLRADDFDTQLPLNVDDTAFVSSGGEPTPSTGWTIVTLSLIRYEINENFREVFFTRRAIDRKEISIMEAEAKFSAKKRELEEKYAKLGLDEKIPVQRYAKLLIRLLLARFNAMLLSRYVLFEDEKGKNPWLLKTTAASFLTVVEVAKTMETDPELAAWAWYTGSYQQYHSVIPLLVSYYKDPEMPQADRIWDVADHVFGTDPAYPRKEKALAILLAIRDKLEMFVRLKKVRMPLQTKSSAAGNGQMRMDLIPRVPGRIPSVVDTATEANMDLPENQAEISGILGDYYLSDLQLSGETAMNIDWDEWDAFFNV